MASVYPGPVSATQVGSYFVGQYYQVLQQQPDFAHQFYTDASTMIRVDGDSTDSASAMLQIHTLVMSLNITGIEVKTINCLESWSGGVLVVVSGTVKVKDFSGRRKFMQTFLLAPQEKGYFVLNDIFHFLDEDMVHQHTVPVFSETNIEPQRPSSTPLSETPVTDYGFEEEASEYVNSVHINADDAVDDCSVEDQQQQDFESESELEETPPQDSSDLLHNVVEAEPEPVHSAEEPVGEPPKLTYASILRAPKGPYVPAVASRPSFTKSTPPASEWNYPLPTTPPLNVPESRFETAEENPSLDEEGELKSVYVRNLPSTVSAPDIEQEFKIFGRIAPDGVFIRNRKDIGVCYAFVEYEDLQAVQNAVKASPIQFAGKTVYIEERRANSGGIASRGGRRGRGRGNYQSDSLRGRVGGRGFGRGNQDGGDFNKSRGNGFRGGL